MDIPTKYLQFILKYHGRFIDFDGRYGNQCMDLYRAYVEQVLGFAQSVGVGCAKDVWNNYPTSKYERIANGPNNYPLPGDIVIWSSQYGECGHIAICLYADGSRMVNFSQNDPLRSSCQIQHYSYFAVLGWLHPKPVSVPVEYATLPEGHALKGLHGPADPGIWAWNQHSVIDVVGQCHFDAVKVLCPGTSGDQVQTMRAMGAELIVARLFAKMGERRGDTLEQRAIWFVNEVRQPAIALYNAGVRYMEVHNEPNLIIEGLGVNWNNGVEFATWFSYVVGLLKVDMPLLKAGYPGLSPGGTIPGVRQDSTLFFNSSQQAASEANWLGFHAYYAGDGSTWSTMLQQINTFAEANKSKVVLVSEWSNNNEAVNKQTKGSEYRMIYEAAKDRCKPNVGALCVFVLWSSGAFQHECLVEKNGNRSAIVAALS